MGGVSTLNPNAPAFIPMAYYDVVEDFSDQWWYLVQSSPYFRDYWLQECFQEADLTPEDDDDLLLLDIDEYLKKQEKESENERKRRETDLVSLGALKWGRGNKACVEIEASRRHLEKPPKIVNVKVSPRMINQPR